MRKERDEIIGEDVIQSRDRRSGTPTPSDENYAEMGCGCGIKNRAYAEVRENAEAGVL